MSDLIHTHEIENEILINAVLEAENTKFVTLEEMKLQMEAWIKNQKKSYRKTNTKYIL